MRKPIQASLVDGSSDAGTKRGTYEKFSIHMLFDFMKFCAMGRHTADRISTAYHLA